jgi:hypothetical protein
VIKLEDTRRGLEMVVEEMSNTFMSFSDTLLKAGLVDPGLLKSNLEKFLQLSQRATLEVGEEDEAIAQDSGGGTLTTSADSKDLSMFPMATAESIWDNQDDLPGLRTLAFSSMLPYSDSLELSNMPDLSSSTNPFLEYSLWGLPYQSLPTNGKSAIPYILAGRDSFASRLYFETIAIAVRALRGDGPQEIVKSMFRYKMRYSTRDKILGILAGVLNMMLHGTSQDPTSASASGNGNIYLAQIDNEIIKETIVKEIVLQGGSESYYLSSWEVEHYLRNRWGLAIDSNTAQLQPGGSSKAVQDTAFYDMSPKFVVPNMIPGFKHSEQAVLDVQPLVERLSNEAVTIGQGPRWHFAQVDITVQDFLSNNKRK